MNRVADKAVDIAGCIQQYQPMNISFQSVGFAAVFAPRRLVHVLLLLLGPKRCGLSG